MIDKKYQIKNEILQFLHTIRFENPTSITLTQKQLIYGYNGYKFYIDNIRSSQNTKHFLNRLNQKIFKNSYRRYGQRLKSFVVMEGNNSIRHHIHLVLDRPHRLTYEEFTYLIFDSWSKTKFGYHHIDVQQMYSDGWYEYLLKCRSKTNVLTDIDWENTYSGLSK